MVGFAHRRAPGSHRRPTSLDRFWFGVCYYPEHWDAATRARDAERMRAAGIQLVRLAEFAWDLMEPSEGRFDFSLFDETIERLASVGIETLLCTPTAAPPRWLTAAHPDVLRQDAEGRSMLHGSRQHACHASPTFRRYSREITRRMATHYRDNAHVVGWQTDNELHCHFSECHCDNCQLAFQHWCREKFDDDIARLNAAWGTQFWSQTYGAFEEVLTPRARPTHLNPAHQLDYVRFLSATATRFQRDQVEILRATNPSWFVTHNGLYGHIDYRGAFGADLDFIGYDTYPMFTWKHDERMRSHAYALDRARAWSGNFIIPEHQAGPGGQPPYFHDAPEPGELRLMSYSSVAHGADSLLYFRWRTARFGAEQYWCGLLDHDDVPRRRYEELAQLGREFAVLGPELVGTSVHVEVAIASCDFDAEESHTTYSLGLPSPTDVGAELHAELWERGFAVGCVHPDDDLGGVQLYVIPHYALFDPKWMPKLESFVEAGGTLVVGAHSGSRDLDNNIVSETLPGCLRELTGAAVQEYGKLNDVGTRPLSLRLGAESIAVESWYELLQPAPDAEVVATYGGRPHLEKQPAIVRRRQGSGSVYYVGSTLSRALLRLMLPELVASSGISPLWPGAPSGVSVMRREAAGKRLWFFMNTRDEAVTLPNVPKGHDVLRDEPSARSGELEAYGVLVIRDGGSD